MKKKYQVPKTTLRTVKSNNILVGSANTTEAVSNGQGYTPDEDNSSSGYLWMLLPLITLSLFSCSQSDDIADNIQKDNLVAMTFKATHEDFTTRAQFTADGDNQKITWQNDDKINVMYSISSGIQNQQFTLTGGEGTTVGTFTGKASSLSKSFTLLSPYQGQTSFAIKDGTPYATNIVLPTIQTATAGSFDPHAGLMMGLSTTKWTNESTAMEFGFKNVCSFIKVTPTFDCAAIIVSTRVPNEYLAGKIRIDNTDVPTIASSIKTDSDNKVNKVTLKGAITSGNTYYIAVIPGTFNSGLRVTCISSDGRMATKRASSAVTLNRGQYHDFTAFLSNPSSAAADGIDLGTGDGVLWSSCNVGATAPHEYGDRYAWGDMMPLYSYDTSNSNLNLNGSYYKIENTESNYKGGNDDAAAHTIGGTWRMPTSTEISNLINNCTWTHYDDFNGTGVKGYSVTNNSDATKWIFLPTNSTFCYWSITPAENNQAQAMGLTLTSTATKAEALSRFTSGFIRPVKNSK